MKTYNQFLETPFSEEIKPPEPQEEDPGIKSKQKRQMQIKKQVLLKKMQAVRAGAGADIVAGYEPEGEQLDERNKSDDAFIEGETGSKTSRRNLTRAMSSTTVSMGKGAKGKAEDSAKRRERHKADRGVKTKGTKAGHSGSAYPKMSKTLDDTYPHKKTARLQRKLADRKAGRKHVDDTHHSLRKKTVGEKLPKAKVSEDYYRGTGEKVVARTRKWMDKKGQKGAPGLDAMKARTAEHKAKRGVKEEVVDEAKVDKGRSDYGKASIRNYRRKGPGHGEPAMFDPENKRGKLIDKRREEHKARRGVKGAKVPAYKVSEGTDKAFEYVKKQIAAKYGKSGYVSKDNPRKPQTAAEKAKVRAHQAKVDKENAAARAKDPSQGRYPKG